ncbi:6-bladed beta-propeller, partial [Parabacteroides sp. OttesenSCG-928-G07]|nr:6-bladed beta-propeller [Parabacteroides sp. OttesenSCG-928-G07]
MKSITVIFLIASCLFFSCSDNKQENPALLDNFILPQDTKSVLSSLLTDNYEITQLETTENCLIGKIDKIRKIEGHYYFLSDNKTILHFNEQGEFVSSLNKQGQGPEEYRRIEDFDVYIIEGQTEVWISDNISIKVYDAYDFSYKYKVSFPFIIHKFKRMNSSNILLVTGQSEYSLTLTDKEGVVLSEYLEKEIPFLMFRPVQFLKYGTDY